MFDAISIGALRVTPAPCELSCGEHRLACRRRHHEPCHGEGARPQRTAPAGDLPRSRQPHPFAEFLRTIGRGATLGRPLDETEAEQAMGMILDGAVEPVQLGAFLLVLRYRTETPAELAGFVRAARAAQCRDLLRHRGRPRLAVLRRPAQAAALFRARGAAAGGHGVRVLMHGIEGEGPATTPGGVARARRAGLRIGRRGGRPRRRRRLRLSAAARDLP